jgi:hypothetical protein
LAVNYSLSCRWYHKYKEALQLFELRAAVEQFDKNHIIDDMGTSELEDENWRLIAAYLTVVKPFEKVSKTLGGDTYPGACMVVPMLDQVIDRFTTSNA